MRAAAVFDLDGTLLRDTSAERLLVPYLIRRRLVGLRQLGSAFALAAGVPVLGRTRALRRNKRWLSGVGVDAVAEEMGGFVARVLEGRWNRGVIRRLERLRAQDVSIYLLTGAPDFLASAVGSRWGMRSVVGTPLEIVDGRFTGRLSGPHRFAEAKREALLALARLEGLELSASWGFADHTTDVPFLECFGHPVAVNPDAGLGRTAARRRWEVLARA